jgi:hypothetical protein
VSQVQQRGQESQDSGWLEAFLYTRVFPQHLVHREREQHKWLKAAGTYGNGESIDRNESIIIVIVLFASIIF